MWGTARPTVIPEKSRFNKSCKGFLLIYMKLNELTLQMTDATNRKSLPLHLCDSYQLLSAVELFYARIAGRTVPREVAFHFCFVIVSVMFIPSPNKKHLKNVGPIHHCEPPHAHSADVASGTVAHRLRIDVDDDDNDNA